MATSRSNNKNMVPVESIVRNLSHYPPKNHTVETKKNLILVTNTKTGKAVKFRKLALIKSLPEWAELHSKPRLFQRSSFYHCSKAIKKKDWQTFLRLSSREVFHSIILFVAEKKERSTP